MKHLTEDQIYQLAESACEGTYRKEDAVQIAHLKACSDCFEAWCVMTAIWEATVPKIQLVLEASPEMSAIKDIRSKASTSRVLAWIRIACQKAETGISLVGKQLQQETAAFCFEPLPAMAGRGAGSSQNRILHMEEIEEEDTFLLYDADAQKLMIQFRVPENCQGTIQAYLQFADQTIQEIPLEGQGKLRKGILTGVSENHFDLYLKEN